MYQNKADGHLVWDVLGDGTLANSLGEDWKEVAPKLPGESENIRSVIPSSVVKTTMRLMFGWKALKPENHDIEWIYVRSVMGGQIKNDQTRA